MKKETVKAKKIVSEKMPATLLQAPKSARALTKYLRIGPRKLRIVIDTVRHQPVDRAFAILAQIKRKGARMTETILKSAVANARVLGMDENRLVVAEIRADGGPVMKRFMSRSMGRADRLLKRMSHLFIRVEEGRQNKSQTSAGSDDAKKAEGSSRAVKAKAPAKQKTAKAGKA